MVEFDPLVLTEVHSRHISKSEEFELVRLNCDLSKLEENGVKLVWPKVYAKMRKLPVQTIYNWIARKKLRSVTRRGRIYVVYDQSERFK
jgi:predicted NUDIX family NTP pyrophosphohydrolase